MKWILALALGITTVYAGAQEISGKATYQTSRKLEVQLDSSRMGSEQYEAMMEMLRKQFEKTFILTFKGQESVYEEKPKLKSDQAHGGGARMEIVMIGDGAGDILYKHLGKSHYKRQTDMMGKIFLVEDSLTNEDWTITKESKQIGNYTCFKATRSFKEEQRIISTQNGKDVETVDSIPINIEVWYTPQINVSHGPGMFGGLPGLILEASQNGARMLCTEIVLKSSDKVEIKIPDQGKKVDEETYRTTLDKKLKESRKRMGRPKKGDGDAHEFEIRIGG